MAKYSMINNDDGNEVHELEATTEINAAFEALYKLGWSLIIHREAEVLKLGDKVKEIPIEKDEE